MFKKLVGAAFTAAVLSTAGAQAASVDATSYSATGHSVWFSSAPPGASGSGANKFLFENTQGAESNVGTFTVNGDGTASLTGTVRNAAGQGFSLMLDLATTADPGVYKNGGGGDPTTWSFWDITAGKLTSLTAGISDYLISMHGKKDGKDLAAQLGVGANDKNGDFGFSTWTKFTEDCGTNHCSHIKGDINISLSDDPTGGGIPPVPLPAGMFLLPAGLAVLGAMRRRRKAA